MAGFGAQAVRHYGDAVGIEREAPLRDAAPREAGRPTLTDDDIHHLHAFFASAREDLKAR